MNWTNFWDAVNHNHAILAAGVALVIIGAIFRWFEQASRFLGRASWQRADPYGPARAHAARLRAAGDEPGAVRVEERLQDQRRRMTRYGRAMMLAGAVIAFVSVLVN